MAASSKTQILNEVYELLRKRYKKRDPRPDRMTILEATLYGICHEGATRDQANQALSRFKDQFFDWNEVRVSGLKEIEEVLAGLPAPAERAYRLRRFLRQLFSKTYGFTLEALLKKPQKDATKALQEYEALRSDYVLATVLLHSFGGHAIPVDPPLHAALDRLGISEPGQSAESLRGLLERAVPKNRGAEFADLMEALAHDAGFERICDSIRNELKKQHPGLRDPEPAKPAPAEDSPKAPRQAADAKKPAAPKEAQAAKAAPPKAPAAKADKKPQAAREGQPAPAATTPAKAAAPRKRTPPK